MQTSVRSGASLSLARAHSTCFGALPHRNTLPASYLNQLCSKTGRAQVLSKRCINTSLLTCARSAPKWNPQNVENPQVLPSIDLSPEESVRVQLLALRNNDEPWENHGIQTMYEFSEDAGGMERSRYFGFSKDLYHFDHFLGTFWNRMGPLVYNKDFKLLTVQEVEPGTWLIQVEVSGSAGQVEGPYIFTMVQASFGRKKGCWMTKSLIKQL